MGGWPRPSWYLPHISFNYYYYYYYYYYWFVFCCHCSDLLKKKKAYRIMKKRFSCFNVLSNYKTIAWISTKYFGDKEVGSHVHSKMATVNYLKNRPCFTTWGQLDLPLLYPCYCDFTHTSGDYWWTVWTGRLEFICRLCVWVDISPFDFTKGWSTWHLVVKWSPVYIFGSCALRGLEQIPSNWP